MGCLTLQEKQDKWTDGQGRIYKLQFVQATA